jgi:prefoldin subunit 5
MDVKAISLVIGCAFVAFECNQFWQLKGTVVSLQAMEKSVDKLHEEVIVLRRENQKLQVEVAVLKDRTSELANLKDTLRELKDKEAKLSKAVDGLDKVGDQVKGIANEVRENVNDLQRRMEDLEREGMHVPKEVKVEINNIHHHSNMLWDAIGAIINVVLSPVRWLLSTPKLLT